MYALCPSFKRCGGCSFLHITDEYELKLKETFVRTSMRKMGLEIPVRSILSAPSRIAYRNKAQYPLYADEEGHIHAGFYARRSHTPVCAEECLLQPAAFSKLARAFCEAFEAAGLTCYDEKSARGLLRHLNLREGADESITAEIVINASKAKMLLPIAEAMRERFPFLKGVCANFNTKNTNVIRGADYEVLSGDMTLTQTLCGQSFLHGPASFFQVNRAAATLLFEEARRLLDASASDSVCDLYCGVGAVGQCVAPKSRLHGADVVKEAIDYAAKNAELNGCNAVYVAMDAAAYFAAAGSFDAVLLDPPRGGLDETMVRLLLEKLPRKILYISCNPQTLCRDLLKLTAEHYESDGITPVDLFPKTGHVECVCLLTRKV